MNKKILTLIAIVTGVAMGTFAGPHGHGGHYGPPPPHHGGHHGSWWGRGGCNFWPGFAGGVVGGLVGSSIYRPYPVVAPTVVTTPVVAPTVVTPTVVTTPIVPATTTTVIVPNYTISRPLPVPITY